MQKSKTRTKIFQDLVAILEPMGWAQLEDIAETAGISAVTLYFWVSGKTTHPRLSTLVPVADALGYDVTLTRRKAVLRRAA